MTEGKWSYRLSVKCAWSRTSSASNTRSAGASRCRIGTAKQRVSPSPSSKGEQTPGLTAQPTTRPSLSRWEVLLHALAFTPPGQSSRNTRCHQPFETTPRRKASASALRAANSVTQPSGEFTPMYKKSQLLYESSWRAPASTVMPATASSMVVNSAGVWLRPPTLRTKIMATLATSAICWLS